jgi:hypothetical protein
MPYVSITARRYQLETGATTLGGGAGVDIALAAVAFEGPAVVLTVTPGKPAEIRRADATVAISVDGRPLGDETRPLAHGTRIDIFGVSVLFGDERPAAAPAGKPAEVRARTAEVPALSPAVDVAGLATLEILTSGVDAGASHDLTLQLSHVGRGAHNDIVLDDRSVSGTHATLQWRGDAWYVFDMDSTNGTYVDGARVRGEQRLPATAELRFGDLKATFRASAAPTAQGDGGGTRRIVGVTHRQGRS